MLPRGALPRRWLWGLGFVVAAACLAQLLRWQFIGAHHLALPGEGGWLGKWIGADLLEAIFGRIGSILVLAALYLICLLLVLGMPPVALPAASRRCGRGRRPTVSRLGGRHARRAKARGVLIPLPLPKPAKPLNEKRGEARRAPAGAAAARPAGGRNSGPAGRARRAAAPGARRSSMLPRLCPASNARKSATASLRSTPVSCENYELPSLDLLDPLDLENRETRRSRGAARASRRS